MTQFPTAGIVRRRIRAGRPGRRKYFSSANSIGMRRSSNRKSWAHRDLLRLRREDSVFSRQDRGDRRSVIGPEAFLLRWFDEEDDDRLCFQPGTGFRLVSRLPNRSLRRRPTTMGHCGRAKNRGMAAWARRVSTKPGACRVMPRLYFSASDMSWSASQLRRAFSATCSTGSPSAVVCRRA